MTDPGVLGMLAGLVVGGAAVASLYWIGRGAVWVIRKVKRAWWERSGGGDGPQNGPYR